MRAAVGKSPLSNANIAIYAVTATNYNDIAIGTNGSCGTLCTATSGYDYITGLGSPQANYVIPAMVNQP